MKPIKIILNETRNKQHERESSCSYQQLVANLLGSKQIAYNPDLVKITGSINAAILLNQLLYWHRKGYDPEWIYKTANEMKKETGLTRSQQDLAIKSCKKLNLIEVKLKGIPAKRHFKLNLDPIIKKLQETIKSENTADKIVENRQTCL